MRSKKAIKNTVFSLGLQFINIICGFIIPQLIIRTYGSNVNGLISSITQFLSYIMLLESGFGPVIKSVLYKPIAKKNKQEIESILLVSENFFKKISYFFLIYLCILVFVYPSVVNFDYFFTASLIVIIAISTFAEYFFGITYRLYLQASQKSYIVSIIQIATTILNTIVVCLLVKMNFSIQIVKLASAFIFTLRPIFQNIYVKKNFKIQTANGDKKYEIKQKWDGMAQHVAIMIHNNTDIVILTLFANMKEVSVYAVYQLIMNGIKSLISSFNHGIEASFGDMIAVNEKQHLNKSFQIYELFYFTLITIIFGCTMILIVPFVGVYTKNISDANYCRPLFGFLFVLSETINLIRSPYHTLIMSAGHFKQVKKGSWVEAFMNVILSLILVHKFGLVGVMTATIIATSIRTIEIIIYASKNIFERSNFQNIKRLLIIFGELFLMLVINKVFFNNVTVNSYFGWVSYAFIVGILAVLVVCTINIICYRKDFSELMKLFEKIFLKRKRRVKP